MRPVEFPAILFDLKERRSVSEFHEYVRPTVDRELSPFCKSLTGISQVII